MKGDETRDILENALGYVDELALTVADVAAAVKLSTAEKAATGPIIEALVAVSLIGEVLRELRDRESDARRPS